MAKLALSVEMLKDYHKLEKRARNRVVELTGIFQRLSVAELGQQGGVNLEKHNNQCDPRARTVRIDDNHRGVVCAINDGLTFILHKILTHDDSDSWMERNRFKANVQTGALEVLDLEAIETVASGPVAAVRGETPLFAHRKDKEFRQLGIDPELVPTLRLFTNDEHLGGLLNVLPAGQAEALIELTSDDSPDEIYARVAGSFTPGSIGEDDLEKALDTPASRSLFKVVASESELQDMLEKPLAQWRTFLHHTQEAVAYKPVHNGPVRVTGGAGTGKTVVAMHRAKFLASELEDRSGRPILFTTFTKNLAEGIERELRELGGADLLDVVEVINADRLAHRIVREVEGGNIGVSSGRDLDDLWEEVALELGTERRAEFLANEWEHVILAQRCRSRSDYFQAPRRGRGIRLDRRGRAEVWKAVEAFNQKLSDRNARTFLQLADAAAGYLSRREVRPYRHVIVDEAQDLHETQWHMLRAAVAESENDMFIVGDSHQRIYDRRSSLSKVGINIRGRSHRLRINYRTTHEILRWSLQLLGDFTYDDLDEGLDSHDFAGYHSFIHGPEPTLHGANSRRAEIEALIEQVQLWIRDGVDEEDIAVVARRGDDLESIETKLKAAGSAVCRLGPGAPTQPGVRLANMHRVKGLEFRCVAITGVNDERIPEPSALTDKSADEVQHRLDINRERCLLYVAATRAREDLWIGWSGRPSRFLGAVAGDLSSPTAGT